MERKGRRFIGREKDLQKLNWRKTRPEQREMEREIQKQRGSQKQSLTETTMREAETGT